MRILIAEDDVTSRDILIAFLEKQGHEVVVTLDGAQALQAMRQADAPKMAILDWMMPEMDGIDVCRNIRALDTEEPPYILMLTGKAERGDIVKGLDAGANDYLVKPFDFGELRARVDVGRRMVEMQSALIESRKALAHEATHDPLTNVLNRRAILKRLEEELARAERNGGELAIGMCDIDHFKQVNDTYGHQAGDEVLCGFVRTLTGCLRKYDSLGRLGGEEFLLILPLMAGTDCMSLFERIRRHVSQNKIETCAGPLSITVSIGVASRAPGDVATDHLLQRADDALYVAKSTGRNRIHLFSTETTNKATGNS